MPIQADDLETILDWPQCHPGETAILPDGTPVLLEDIALYFCKFGPIPSRLVSVEVLSEFFKDVVPSLPLNHDHLVLSHPVLLMKDELGRFFGLDGCARLELARQMGLPSLPAIQLAEADVRKFGKFDLEFPTDEKTTVAERGAYRAAHLANSVHSTHVASRLWLKDAARRTEPAFGAGSRDGARLGRPYCLVRAHQPTSDCVHSSGRRSVPDVESLESAMGRVLALIRTKLAAAGYSLALNNILGALEKGRIRSSAAPSASYPIVLGLPHVRDLERYAAQPTNRETFRAGLPTSIDVDNLEPHFLSDEILGLIFLLRDLGVLRLRIQEFDLNRNALVRDAGRAESVEREPYDTMLFDRSSRTAFKPVPDVLGIPGYIDPMAVAKETSVLACDYAADYFHVRPMFRVASILGQLARALDPIIDGGTAVCYLQYRARARNGIRGPLDNFWDLALKDLGTSPDWLELAAMAAVRARKPVPFTASEGEYARIRAA